MHEDLNTIGLKSELATEKHGWRIITSQKQDPCCPSQEWPLQVGRAFVSVWPPVNIASARFRRARSPISSFAHG